MSEEIDRDSCPKCGSRETDILRDPSVAYPDEYTKYSCKSCGWLVGIVDNSPYVSCHDFKGFVIDF